MPLKTEYKLPQGHELRIEVKEDKELLVTAKQGQAEVFGTELSLGEQLTLRGQKLAVFTWHGVVLELTADAECLEDVTDVVYEADETPMVEYLNASNVVEQRRRAAREAGGQGPRTIVVGPTDVGKSSLCKLLLNYAVRYGFAPTAVDLDIGQGGIAAPGSIAATPVEAPVDVEEGLPVEVPLVYFYSHVSPADNPELYKFLVERLAALLDRRAEANAEVRAAGMVINTMGWVDGLGYELLLHSIAALRADVVLVVGQDRLYSQLSSELRARKDVSLVRLPKSGGVVMRPPPLRKLARAARVKEYFYGAHGELSPHSRTLGFSELRVYRVGGGPRAPTSALPIGAEPVADPLRVAPVTSPGELLHSLLAVSHAPAPEFLLSVNVAGFIYVSDVDVTRNTVTFLSPSPGPLPGKFLLAGSVKLFME
ncbi:hypothetical protein WJX81_007645 [Elliptochloris bilobata]|uniref:Protein CLP1 homolog n=1 Tax=Elliptochloris bilobata TaxID=381761 RepID=A0AAW1S8J0_9CHLO